jgi:hypothetical protein
VPSAGIYLRSSLDFDQIIGISPVYVKQDYPIGVGTADGGIYEDSSMSLKKGTLVGLQMHMADSSQDFLMTGEKDF